MTDHIETKYNPENDWEENALWDIINEFDLTENNKELLN